MSEQKSQSAGTITEEAPGENTVQVTFLPEGKTVQFEHGKLPYEDHGKEESILDIALNYGVTLDHACGGNCACTTCHVWVKEGAENLSPMDDDEADRREYGRRLAVKLSSRLPGVITTSRGKSWWRSRVEPELLSEEHQ